MSWVDMFGVEDPLNTEGQQRNTWQWFKDLARESQDMASRGVDALESWMGERKQFFKDQTKLESLLGTGITEGLSSEADFYNARKGAMEPGTTTKLKLGSGLKQTLFSPVGQSVDLLTKYAKDLSGGLTDSTNQAWNDLYEAIVGGPLEETEQARRGLATESKLAIGEMQDLSRARGSARDPYAEREQISRLHEAMGTANAAISSQEAQIKFAANKFMREYVPQFTQNMVKFANDWVYSGGRGQYLQDMQMAVTAFATGTMQASAVLSDLSRSALSSFTAITTTEQNIRAQLFQAANDALAGAISSSIGSIASMGGGMKGGGGMRM